MKRHFILACVLLGVLSVRRLHLFRPDLIPYPIPSEWDCRYA